MAGTSVGRGGVQTHLKGLTAALLSEGHEVKFLSLGTEWSAQIRDSLFDVEQAGRFTIFRAYFNEGKDRASAFGAALAIVRELWAFRPNVYLACGTGWNLFLPAWLSHSCGRLVFHEVMSGEAGGWNDSRWAVRWLFDQVVAQAEPVAQNFRRTFGWNRAIGVLPAFSEPFEDVKLSAHCFQQIPYGQARAAIFGRLVPHKRVAWLVSQWPRLRRSLKELHIFGTGPDADPISRAIRDNNWQEAVFYHGEYPAGEAYASLLGSFDLTLLPTVGAEGAPLVLLESMACGVPFVSTDAGGIADYANPDCLIVDKADPEAFLRGVESLCERLASGDVDSSRLKDFYSDKFSFEALKTKWLDFLASLAIS